MLARPTAQGPAVQLSRCRRRCEARRGAFDGQASQGLRCVFTLLSHDCVRIVSLCLFLCFYSSDADVNVVVAATAVLERVATVRLGRVQVVSETVSLPLAELLSHSDSSVRSAAVAALRVASDSIECRRVLAGYDDVAKLLTKSLCGMNPVEGDSRCI